MLTPKKCCIFCGSVFVVGFIGLMFIVIFMKTNTADDSPKNPTQLSGPLVIEVDYSHARKIPDTMFGIELEEVNHAVSGGLWAELVRNRGFEEMGHTKPTRLEYWGVIGGMSHINVSMELTSCFEHNKVALRMDVLSSHLPSDVAVGIYNSGYWGMNIVEGHTYKVTLYGRSTSAMNVTVAFTSFDGFHILASTTILVADIEWKKADMVLIATGSNHTAKLQLTTTTVGSIWFDQVSAMPTDTYKGHGFRKDLIQMLLSLKPGFLRFPGGRFVDGVLLRTAPRWKETIGPWEDRPGHYNEVWSYWSDDGLGFLEYLQLAEDLGATPLWVVNAGISYTDEVNSSFVGPFVQDMLDGVEFARGDINSSWGSLRAKYGHPEPFSLRHIAIGSDSCQNLAVLPVYRGNYRKFYNALKEKYTDINVINNCDPTAHYLDDPADMFQYNIYDSREQVLFAADIFDEFSRSRPKVAVNSYDVVDPTHPNNTLINALAEAEFLIGLERNSDVISMASYAPLFNNIESNARLRWRPNAIYFDTWRAVGSPSYWVQSFFVESSGAFLLNLNHSGANNCTASAIRFRSSHDGKVYVKVKVVNMQENYINMVVTFKGVGRTTSLKGLNQTVLTSYDPHDTNTFEYPTKVIPKLKLLEINQNEWTATLDPYSLSSFDLYIT